MDTLRKIEFSFLYILCLYTTLINTAELVTPIRYLGKDAVNISCANTSNIQILNIDVNDDKTSCRYKNCVLNSQDMQTIEDNCNGHSSCLVDYNFTSACLRGFRYMNLSYTCKHENNNSKSTFEKDAGIWINVTATNVTWHRDNHLIDHTRINKTFRGYSMVVFSYHGTAKKARIITDKKFVNGICLTFWYQFFNKSYDCSLMVYKHSGGNQTLLFTVDGNSSSFDRWINQSVDLFGSSPFKIALEADFSYRYSTLQRAILIDDTSIAYRPCQGQQMDETCQDLNSTIKIDCETRHIAGDIKLSLQNENLSSNQTNCGESFVERSINTFCGTFNNSEKCEFKVFDVLNKTEECSVLYKNVYVTYQCFDTQASRGSLKSPVQYDIIGISAGVSGGVLVTIIAVFVIYRIKRYKPGKQEAISSNDNKAFDELQNEEKGQQKPTLSKSFSQDIITPTNSYLSIPEQLNQDGQESANLYNMSNEVGTYDVSGNERQRGNTNDNNIYSHTADSIYDSGSHHKLPDRNEETYDHFFGQQTEDEYDTTART